MTRAIVLAGIVVAALGVLAIAPIAAATEYTVDSNPYNA